MTPPPLRGRWLLIAWFAALAVTRSGSPSERDPYWQARAGLENLGGIPLARPDSWGWAPVGGLFEPTSPGWNLILGSAWGAGGFWGLFVVSVAVIGSYLALVSWLSHRLGATPIATLLGLLPLVLVALPFFSMRATMAVQVLLLASVVLVTWWSSRAARQGPAANTAVAGVGGLALSAAGNWLHLSWLALAPLVGVGWAAFWLFSPLSGVRRLGLIVGGFAGLGLGILATPYGLAEGLARTEATRRACEGVITEWLPVTTPGLPAQWYACAALAVAGVLVAAGWVLRRLGAAGWGLRRLGAADERVRLVACLTLLALPAAVAGLGAVRFQGVALLTLAPLAGPTVKAVAGRLRLPTRLAQWGSGHPWRVVLTATLIVLLPGVGWLAWPHGRAAEFAAASALPSGCHLFSDDGTGGAVVLLRPEVPVWLDGRADYYGRERLMLAARYLAGLEPDPVPAGTTCVLLPVDRPAFRNVIARLDSDPQWRRTLDADGYRVWLPVGTTP